MAVILHRFTDYESSWPPPIGACECDKLPDASVAELQVASGSTVRPVLNKHLREGQKVVA